MRKNELVSYRQKVAVAEGVTGSAIFDEGSSFCRRFNTVAKCRAVLNDIPFLQYFNLFLEPDVGDVVKRLSRSSELAELAASLMGVKEVRLYQDSLFFKRAGDTHTNYHSDLRMAPFDTNNMCTIWVPLRDIPASGSGLVFVSGSHKDLALNFWRSQKQVLNMDLSKRYRNKSHHHMPLNLGDVTAHSGWVLHSAGANTGTEDRLALAVSYVDADARVRKGWDEFDGDTGHGEDYLSYGGWVKDVKVGKRIKHPNVPIIKW